MRAIWTLAALGLLAGCGDGRAPPAPPRDPGAAHGSAAHYAFRLPAERVRPVLQSNADGCRALGPARCRIESLRYRVDEDNRVHAALAILVDPAIVRSFGDAVGTVVVDASGVLVDADLTALDANGPARGNAMLDRLRNELRAAEASGTDQSAARAARIRDALATIAQVEASQGQTLADAPVLFRYVSADTLPGPNAADKKLRSLGTTLRDATAELLHALAQVLPWLLLMALVASILRWIQSDMPLRKKRQGPIAAPAPPEDRPWPWPREERGRMKQWFARDEGEAAHD